MRISIVWNRQELDRLQPGVIVEQWRKGRTLSGKRKIRQAFSVEDQKRIEIVYKLSCRWYLQSGIPNEHSMSLEDYHFFSRVAEFFATEL